MGATSIEWTDFSINPIRARDKATGAVGHFCEKISAGCKNCYASRLQTRFNMHEFVASNRDKVECFLDESKLKEVLRRKKPTRYFWCDMTDMFGDWVPDEWIDKCFATMALTPRHTHQVLTKRAERMKAYSSSEVAKRLLKVGRELARGHGANLMNDAAVSLWPLPNVWKGVSVESQELADERIPLLLQTPAAVRFLSCEPLLGPVDLEPFLQYPPMHENYKMTFGVREWRGVDWVIVGGESGHGARPMHPRWVRAIRDQCQDAGVSFFFKQWGEFISEQIKHVRFTAVHSGVPMDEPTSMFPVGKKAAGRLLDGREHNEFPESES